jgi:predicted flap endonuclease-1-like 5' DNA nuclease
MRVAEPEQPAQSDFPSGLSQPALRALANAGIAHLKQLAEWSEADLKRLHGLGPKGINDLRGALAARGLTFAKTSRGKSK